MKMLGFQDRQGPGLRAPGQMGSAVQLVMAMAIAVMPTSLAAQPITSPPASMVATAPTHSEIAAPAEVPPPAGTVVVPILTPVALRVDSTISSKTAKRGDRFAITVIAPVIVDGVVVAPTGTRGEGEVVHAAGVGFGGRPGELIVAARFLVIGDRHLPLQSFRLSRAGKNNAAEAIGLVAAAGVIGAVAAMFVTGTSAEIAAGQIALAKTSEPFSFSRGSTENIQARGDNSQ
jgi:hypothetical protein